jgi:hypothetical protein
VPGHTPNPLTSHGNAGIASWRFNLTHEIHSYEDAVKACDELHMATTPETMTTDRVKIVRDPRFDNDEHYAYKIGPHMWVTCEGETYAVYLYDTPIIRYHPDGTFSVDNGGFNTPTTRERLNAFLPQGFSSYHFRKKLGLRGPGTGYDKQGLWPLDHETRIDPNTTPPTKITTAEVEL